MKKQEFLEKLRRGIAALPQRGIEERIDFYSEMIDDRLEEGLSEEEAVDSIGSVEEVTAQILSETPLGWLLKERVKPKRGMKAWEVVLIALGSPIWLSLLIAAFAVVLSAYVVIWAVIISLWAVGAAVASCLIGGIAAAVVLFLQGNGPQAIAMLGAGLLCGGLAILFFLGNATVTKAAVSLTKRIVIGIKKALIGKGDDE